MHDLRFILIIGLLFGGCICRAQNTDSLRHRLAMLGEDTEKVKTLDALCDALESLDSNFTSAEYGKQAAALADKLSWKKGQSLAYHNLGVALFNLGNFPESLNAYLASLKARNDLHDKKGTAASYNNIGILYSIMGNQQEALKNQIKSLQLKRETGDSGSIHHSYTNIGICYEKMTDTARAREYYLLALKKLEAPKDEHQSASALMNVGGTYSGSQPKEALAYYEKALLIMQKYNDKFGEAVCYFDMSACYDRIGKRNEALRLTLNTLEFARSAGFLDLAKEAEHRVSVTYEKLGDYTRSLDHFKEFVKLRDSLFNEENTKNMVRSEMNFEFEKKEAITKAEQEKKEMLAAADRRRRNIVLAVISGFGLVILGFALFAYRSFLQKKKANFRIRLQKEFIEEKQKEILDSIYYARRIQRSLLPSEKYIERVIKQIKEQ